MFTIVTLLKGFLRIHHVPYEKPIIYNSWSKSARSLKYSPHWGALQDFEWTNAKIFTTQQLSKLWLISKSFAKELVNTKMNNILKFHQNPLTINACHIKIKFKLKLGWEFSQRGMDQSQCRACARIDPNKVQSWCRNCASISVRT